jgi:multimeric flavodoxin WrbA
MKVLVLNSSPHKEKGATGVMVSLLIEGMESAGAEVELVHVHGLDINPCLGCFSCWRMTPGECVQDDDMRGIITRIAGADVLVLATPLYVDGMNGSMKTLVDRMIPLAENPIEVRDGHCRHPLRDGVKRGKLVLVSPCGFTEMDNFGPLVAHVKAMCLNMGREYAGALLRPYGWFFPELKRRGYPVEGVFDALREAGRYVATGGEIPESVQEEVSRDLVSREEVLSYYNQV